jgi:threonine synthase
VASRGAAVAVTDDEMIAATKQMGAATGIFAAPEGAATLAALPHLLERGWIERDQEVVLFNTGSGLKYVDLGN